MELLAHEGVELEGAEAVVVGRSKLVGVPVARLLLMANATVTICHSRTRDLDAVCRRADVLVAAVGVPRLLGAEAVKPGRGRDRRRHQPHSRTASPATSTSRPRPRSPRRSRRCPAGSAR